MNADERSRLQTAIMEDIRRRLSKHYTADGLTALADANGLPNVCENFKAEWSRREDYDELAFDGAVEALEDELRLVSKSPFLESETEPT